MTPDMVVELLKATEHTDSYGESLYWRATPDGTLNMFVNCSDLFYWGTADLEPIETAEDIAALRQAYDDLVLADLAAAEDEPPGRRTFHSVYFPQLYAARRRGMRPQRPWWDRDGWPAWVKRMFCACGPERELGTEG